MSESLKTLDDIERIGGAAAVNFVNTVSAWNTVGDITEYLAGFSDYLDWAGQEGLLWSQAIRYFRSRPSDEQEQALEEVHRLRDALYRILAARARGERLPENALGQLNDLVRRTVSWRCIAASEDSGGREICCAWDFAGAPALAALGPLVWSAAELLEKGPLERVKECPGERCGWLFIDTSKNRSRQWCSMKTCGNAVKVRRFRERRR